MRHTGKKRERGRLPRFIGGDRGSLWGQKYYIWYSSFLKVEMIQTIFS
jgi:hypothetical protein